MSLVRRKSSVIRAPSPMVSAIQSIIHFNKCFRAAWRRSAGAGAEQNFLATSTYMCVCVCVCDELRIPFSTFKTHMPRGPHTAFILYLNFVLCAFWTFITVASCGRSKDSGFKEKSKRTFLLLLDVAKTHR